MDASDTSPEVNPYTSAGIIVWYAFLFMFCLVPIVSILIWMFCKLCSVVEIPENLQNIDESDSQIERIEANVSAFNESEKLRKKKSLLKLMEDQTETIYLHDLIPTGREYIPPIDCQICLLAYDENEEIVKSNNPDCHHVFHKSCMLEWLTSTVGGSCPICRGDFLDVNATPIQEITAELEAEI